MRIVQVSPYDYAHPSGVNRHMFSLGENFERMGNEVKYILPTSRPKEASHHNGNITFIGKPIPIHASGSIVRSPVSPWILYTDFYNLCEMLEEGKFDIVHLHEPLFPPLTTACLRYSRATNIGTFHASRTRSWGYWFWRLWLNQWTPKLDGRIAVSKPAQDFISRYFPGDYNIIPNGIDIERFDTYTEPFEEYMDGKINILFVGRLERRKGFRYLLEAYRRLKADNPDIRLIVVGPINKLRLHYKFLTRSYNLKDVIYVDYVSDQDLSRFYHTADIFCSPATGWESFGIVLLEAMAASKPVLATNIPGYAGVLSQDVDGMMVPPKNITALVEALDLLIRDKSLRESLGKRGREKAENHSWDKVARNVMDYYEQVIDQSKYGKGS